ncbi:MAG: flavodoxin [Acutalibacteraceae bacterium]
MKKIMAALLAMTLTLFLPACAGNNQSVDSQTDVAGTASADSSDTPESSRILIAYFSVPENVDGVDAVTGASVAVKDGQKSGNTEYVAKIIQQTIGGDLFRIETVQNYPLDHDTLVDLAAEEQNENKRPELKSHAENFEQYETVILGYPNWWADLPMPVYTFLEEYDFGAKTIIPFVTHGGSGFSNTLCTISELQPGAHISENTLSLSRNEIADCEEKVTEWAESLGLNAAEPIPENSSDTVLNAVPDPKNQQTLYLWEENNMPAVTQYTQNNGSYADDPDFRPYVVSFPVPDGTKIKGAVLICAGGAVCPQKCR